MNGSRPVSDDEPGSGSDENQPTPPPDDPVPQTPNLPDLDDWETRGAELKEARASRAPVEGV